VVKQLATNAVGRLMDTAGDDTLIAGMLTQAGATALTLQDALRSLVLSDLFRRQTPGAP
jgi:hypothetical protein